MTPPGSRWSRAIWKNSSENREASPPIQGFDGSEMITSYRLGAVSRKLRPSAMTVRTRGSARTLPWIGAKKREASTTAGSISTTSTASTGCLATAPTVIPLPRPMTSARRGPGWSSIGRCPDMSWVGMSIAVPAPSPLEGRASRVRPGHLETDKRSSAPLAPSA
jgi:hypothetical protein